MSAKQNRTRASIAFPGALTHAELLLNCMFCTEAAPAPNLQRFHMYWNFAEPAIVLYCTGAGPAWQCSGQVLVLYRPGAPGSVLEPYN